MTQSDGRSGDDAELDEFAEAVERHRTAIFELISDYMEEEELDVGIAVQLLIGATVGMRMTAYGMSVESPSVGGLKLDLDQLRSEVDEYLRDAKNGAEEYIAQVTEARAAAEAEGEDGEDEEAPG